MVDLRSGDTDCRRCPWVRRRNALTGVCRASPQGPPGFHDLHVAAQCAVARTLDDALDGVMVRSDLRRLVLSMREGSFALTR